MVLQTTTFITETSHPKVHKTLNAAFQTLPGPDKEQPDQSYIQRIQIPINFKSIKTILTTVKSAKSRSSNMTDNKTVSQKIVEHKAEILKEMGTDWVMLEVENPKDNKIPYILFWK